MRSWQWRNRIERLPGTGFVPIRLQFCTVQLGPLHPDVVGPLTSACGTSTAPCRHWNVGTGNPQAFIAALAAIQQSADGCADGGGTVNPN